MDQQNGIDDKDDSSENYVLNAIEKYHNTLEQILKKDDDPTLWLESCRLAGKLETYVDLGIVNNGELENTIKKILQSHKESTQLFTDNMKLLKHIEFKNNSDPAEEE